MNWLQAAILSAGVMGAVNIIDSHLLSRRMPSLRAYLLPVGVIHLILGLVLLYMFPLPEGMSIWPLAAAVGSSVLRTVAISIMLHIMTREDVSRVIPVVHTFPIFVAILAVLLLGESLVSLQWFAIVIVVGGAVLVSLRQSPTGANVRLGRSFGLLFISSLLIAVADVASKFALGYISFWNMYYIGAICMSAGFLVMSLRRSVFEELRSMPQRNSALALMVFNEMLAPVGIVLSFWAIERGPVSLVSTILSTRPIFVFIYALVLGRALPLFLEWRPTRGTLVLRLVATAMIVGGIAIIQLL
ncbi:MAG: DMT family transporter [Chloroflexi bacterium]|nr:DMT family transporter [Chloroflexota bacterium]